MIELRKKLYESLLDDEDILMDNSDSMISQNVLDDLTSDFYNDYSVGGIVREPAKIVKNHIVEFNIQKDLVVGGRNFKEFKPINNYLPGIDTLKANEKIYIYKNKDLNKKDICENIQAPSMYIYLREGGEISNINFLSNAYLFKLTIESLINPIILKNIKISSTGPFCIAFRTHHIPELSNIKCPKDTMLRIYDVRLVDDNKNITKNINDLFDLTYKTTIFDNKKNEEVLRKTDIKTIQVILKNERRYKLMDNLFKLKKGTKMSDLIKNLPNNIINVIIRNNNITLNFTKFDDLSNPNQIKTIGFLDDGWRLEIY